MRPLCGAIIVAGAVIGLGLTAQGFGLRYHTGLALDPDPVPYRESRRGLKGY
jgi:hypothetical protein